MFENKKGFSDLITMTIIGGILGSLFIVGVFVWKEIELFKVLNYKAVNSTQVADSEKNQDMSEQESEWLTYSNKKYGITFKYPKGWQLDEEGIDNHIVTVKSLDDSSAYEYYPDFMSIYFYESIGDMLLNASKATSIDEMIKSNNILTEREDIVIDGISGQAFIEGGYVGGLHVVVKTDNGWYDIYISTPNNIINREDILKTVEFETLTIGQTGNCLPEQRGVDTCIQVYQPVCASIRVQCIRAPCPEEHQTYSNSCEACKNNLVYTYTEGECTGKDTEPYVYLGSGMVSYVNEEGKEIIVAQDINNTEDVVKYKIYKKATLSPNGKFILLQSAGFEWYTEEVYDIASGNTYNVNGSSGDGGSWLEDNRIRIEGECGMGISCGIYESVNSDEPWILERISDYIY